MRTTAAWLAGVGAVVGWAEWLDRRWSRMLVSGDRRGGSEAIVVLGFRNPQERINVVNRWRARVAVRSVDERASATRLICSGGGPAGRVSEARLLADHARDALGFGGPIVVEDRSRTTWENVAHAIPLMEHDDVIRFASQPAHALKARMYLLRQRPDLADRLVRADDHRFGEWIAAKPLLAMYGVWSLRRSRRTHAEATDAVRGS